MRCLRPRNDPRDQVEGEDALGPLVVAVHRERDALVQKRLRGEQLLAVQLAFAHVREAFQKLSIVLPNLSRSLEHFIAETSRIVFAEEWSH